MLRAAVMGSVALIGMGSGGRAAGLRALGAASERLRIVSTLIRLTGDWELAEDCFQDAVARALTSLLYGVSATDPLTLAATAADLQRF